MHHARVACLNVDDYLSGELESDIRHEYVDGEAYAMAGAGRAHNLIVTNLVARLRVKVRSTSCLVFAADMKVKVAAWNAFYYPDVVLGCDPSDDNDFYLESPCLIVEVLSPSTERIDQREKLLAYRTLASLREYVLIAQDKRHIDVYRRAGSGEWHHEVLGNGDSLRLECVSASLSLDEVYEDVPQTTTPNAE